MCEIGASQGTKNKVELDTEHIRKLKGDSSFASAPDMIS